MKRIIITDTHLGLKKAHDFYLEMVFRLFEDVRSYARENDIKELIHLGDFFDNRKALSLKTLGYAQRIASNLQTFDKSYLILGNHDIYYKDQYIPNSHQAFWGMRHIEVVDEPTTVGNMLLVPWLIEGTDMESFKQQIADTSSEYCLGHFEMNGAVMNRGGVVARDHTFGFADFQKFKRTLSGHFHSKSNYQHNVEYIGSPFHMDFNDHGPRGWHVFDDETGEIEFVEWTAYPKYIIWEATQDNITSNNFHGNVVKIKFNTDFGTGENNRIIEAVKSLEPLQVFSEFNFGFEGSSVALDEEARLDGLKDIHYNFIDTTGVPEHIEETKLYKVMDSLYNEVAQK